MLQILNLVYVWVASFHYDHVTIARSVDCFCRECLEILGDRQVRRQLWQKRDGRECVTWLWGGQGVNSKLT